MNEDNQNHSMEQREIALTVFMMVKSMPQWLGLTSEEQSTLLATHIEPILKKHHPRVTLRLYDVEFYSARVTDLWVWEATDHLAYESLVEICGKHPSGTAIFRLLRSSPASRTPGVPASTH
jgi:hypothetical protein